MRVLIHMPVEDFDPFMEICDRHERPEFVIMSQAVYTRRPSGRGYSRTMRIECDIRQAQGLLELAAKFWPPAATAIESAIVTAHAEKIESYS